MPAKYIQLHNPNGEDLYPRTDWRAILDKPSFATVAQLNTKQDILTTDNAGDNISITVGTGNIIKINADLAQSYSILTDKPSINNIVINGALNSAQLGLPIINDTNTGFEIADEDGNVAFRITTTGHIKTKSFDSSTLPTALSQFINDVGYVTSSYHDATKLDNTTTAINAALATVKVVKFSTTSGTFNILNSDYTTTLVTIDTTTGTLSTSNFNSTTLTNRVTILENTAITTTNLGSALANGHYNISLFNNDSNFVTSATMAAALGQKQDTLSSVNAGTNITITTVGGVVKINSTGGGGGGSGVSDYNLLNNLPSINGHLIIGNQGYDYYQLPQTKNSNSAPFELADEDGNVALRLLNGHLITKLFNSSSVLSDISTLQNNVATLQGNITDIQTNYATKTYVTNQGYATLIYVNNQINTLSTSINGKQDVLTSSNAGDNITITTVGGVQKINATIAAGVDSIGGATGVITLGAGLAINNRQLYNTGVISIGSSTSSIIGLGSGLSMSNNVLTCTVPTVVGNSQDSIADAPALYKLKIGTQVYTVSNPPIAHYDGSLDQDIIGLMYAKQGHDIQVDYNNGIATINGRYSISLGGDNTLYIQEWF